MEDLLKHHIHDTERRFNELREDLADIADKLNSLNQFKIETIMAARWVSLAVSAFCGLATMLITAGITYFIEKH